MYHLARNNLLAPIFQLAELHGVHRRDILAEIGLDERLATEPGAFVESTKLIDATECAAALSGRNDFGLTLFPRPGHLVLGPIGLLIQQCTTVADAAREGTRYINLHNTALRYTLTPVKREYVFRLEIKAHGKYHPRHYVEALLTGCVDLCRAMLGPGWHPSAAFFAHKRMASPAAYRKALGIDPLFEQKINAIVASRKDFDRKLHRTGEARDLAVHQFLDDLERQKRSSIAGIVASLVRPLLSSGEASASKIAKILSMTPRTLQRRLADEGTSYHRILAQTRFEIFRDYIPSKMSLTEFAPMLGFSEASAVSRFVKQQTGSSARSLRHRGKVSRQGSASARRSLSGSGKAKN
jgi:AraC-like DNA-binding protein